ncbi:MAG TPA: C4-dicarboxylate ABC transporter, partial [Clostridiales bacterium UBA8960]|nr:C4-dicarboxylate ABC transporter [Clostridiales bacterium UBA8960]
KHYEISPYFSYTQHLMVPDLIIINSDVYGKMSAENKATFEKLMNEAIDNQFKVWNESVEAAKKVAIENGATFVEVDITPFQANCQPLHDEVIAGSDFAKNLYEAVRGLAK